MARPVYSELLAAVQGLNGQLDITAPGGFVLVLRDLDVYYGGSVGGVTVRMLGTLGQTIWSEQSGSPSGWVYWAWRGRQVISPGLTASLVSDSPVDMTLSGYKLAV